MSFGCQSYVLYITRMSSVCHSYVLVCHSYVTRMSSVCHLYVLVCHPYVTRMYSYVTRISLVWHPYVTRTWFYHEPFISLFALYLTNFGLKLYTLNLSIKV